VPQRNAGVVSIVLVNYRGADDTVAALKGIADLDWPTDRLEVVVVENGSGDDSAERIRAAAPEVTMIESTENLGFAGGCNLGVAAARGEYVALLNSDARPDPQWLTAAVDALEADPGVASVASRVLDWAGETIDYVDAALSWTGRAYKPLTGHPRDDEAHGTPKDVLFATGSAMIVRAAAWDAVGGFDDDLFMFYEDVDLGWRLNLAGHRVRYVPGSLVFHRHHASMKRFGAFREEYLLERNALTVLYKNAGDDMLARSLPAALALIARRSVAAGDLDSTQFDIRRAGATETPTREVPAESLAGLFAVDQFVDQLPRLVEKRRAVQTTRVVDDAAIGALLGDQDDPPLHDARLLEGYQNIVNAFGVLDGAARRRRILVVTGDSIGRKLAGPGIRAWSICAALSAEHDVRLVSTASVEPIDAPFELAAVARRRPDEMAPHEAWADVIIAQGHVLLLFPVLGRTQKVLVVDVYDPLHLEQLEQGREKPFEQWDRQILDATDVLNHQLQIGDFFLCASERQRLFWLGQLAAMGRINAYTYGRDEDLRSLIDIVPFGLSDVPPVATRPALRGVVDGIGADDRIVVWGGGLYNWFDPETLIRAVGRLAATRPDIRLFFMGTAHPNPNVPEMAIVQRCRSLAAELGLTGRNVFFNDSWVAFEDRANYLLEADAGVSTHFQHVETTFSFRTRILDYLWAGLPIVATDGDSFADLIRADGLGAVVPERDVDALAAALERVLYDEEYAASAREAVAEAARSFTWSETLAPLVEFCRHPVKAADRMDGTGAATSDLAGIERRYAAIRPGGLRYDLGRVAHYLRNGGVGTVLEKVRARRSGA
jgi:GT2 family glycosyltransferase/glycosyltransferase involved in cell wall biosynthesis